MSLWRPKDRSARELWQFARKSLRLLLLFQRKNITSRASLQPSHYSPLKSSFQTAFSSYRSNSLLSPLLSSVILSTPDDILHLWVSELVRTEVQAEVQGQGLKAWVSSWWRSPIPLPDLRLIPSKLPSNEWITLRLQVTKVSIGVVQTSQRSGDVLEGIALEMKAIRTELRASPTAGSVGIQCISLQTWRKCEITETCECLTAPDSAVPQVLVQFSQESVATRVELTSPVLTYSTDLQKLLLSLSSSLDFSAEESEAAWEAAHSVNSLGKAAYRSLVKGTKPQFSLKVTAGTGLLLLSRKKTLKLTVPSLTLDQISSETASFRLFSSETSLIYLDNDEETTILPSISAQIAFSPSNIAARVTSPVQICLSRELLQSLATLQDFEPDFVSLHESEKRTIMRSAVLQDLVERGNSRFFAVLSGAYVYFFAQPQDLVAFSYFYVRDCQILREGNCDLRLISPKDDCEMRFSSESRREAWKRELETHIEDEKRAISIRRKRKIHAKIVSISAEMPFLSVEIDHFVGVVEGLQGQFTGLGRELECEIVWDSLKLRERDFAPLVESKGRQKLTITGSNVGICLDSLVLRVQKASIERLLTLVSACKRDFPCPLRSQAESSAPQCQLTLLCPACAVLLEAETGLLLASLQLSRLSGQLETSTALTKGKVMVENSEVWEETGYSEVNQGSGGQKRWKMMQIAVELDYLETEIERKYEILVKNAEFTYIHQPLQRLIESCTCFLASSEVSSKSVEFQMRISDLILLFPLRPQCNSPGKLRISSIFVTKTALSQLIQLQGIASIDSSCSIQPLNAEIRLNSDEISVICSDFTANISSEDVKWALKLVDLNIAYDDHRLPRAPQGAGREVKVQMGSISLGLQTAPVLNMRIGAVSLGYKSGLEQWEAAGNGKELAIATEAAEMVLKASSFDYYIQSSSIFHTWLTLTTSQIRLNSPALAAFYHFCTDSLPIYTLQDEFTPYDYLRPGEGQISSPESQINITGFQTVLYISDDTGGMGVTGTFGLRVGKAAVQRPYQAAMQGDEERTVEIVAQGVGIVCFEGGLDPVSGVKRSNVMETAKVEVDLSQKRVNLAFEGLQIALLVPEFLRFAQIIASLQSSSQSESQNAAFSLFCNIRNVSLLLIATAPSGNFPLFRLNLPQFELCAIPPCPISVLSISLQGYNRQKDHWEPVIEPVTVNITVDSSTLPGCMYIEFASALELTCSEAVLTSLSAAWTNRHVKSPPERLEIRNFTSYLLCSTYEGETLSILPGEKMAHSVDFLAHFCCESPLQPLAITVISEDETALSLTDIDLRKFRTKKVGFGRGNWGTLALEIDSEGRKVLTLWAKLVFFNHTLLDFTLRCDQTHLYPLEAAKSCGLSRSPQQLIEFLPANIESAPLESSLEALLQGPQCYLRAGNQCLRLCRELTAYGTALHIHASCTYRNCLPVSLHLTIGKHARKRLFLSKGETYEDCEVGLDWEEYLVEVAGFASKWFKISSLKEAKEVTLHKNSEIVHINVQFTRKTAHIVSFYCHAVIINSSYLPLRFFYDERASQPVSSQEIHSDIVILGRKEAIWTKFLYYKAEKLDIETAGVQFPLVLGSEPQIYDMRYSIKAHWPAQDEAICTKIVTIAPKLVLMNGLGVDITVKQAGAREETRVNSKERMAIYWANSNIPPLLKVKTSGKSWSEPFPLSLSLSWLYNECFLRISLLAEQTSSVYLLEEELDSALQVQNCTSTYGVHYHQVEDDSTVAYVVPGQCQRFAWTFPAKTRSLLLYISSEVEETDVEPVTVSLDRLQKSTEISVFQPKTGLQRLYLSVVRRGYAKTVVISDTSPSEKAQIDSISSFLHLTAPRIGLSLVASPSNSYELLYISLTRFEFQRTQTQKRCQSSLTIGNIQADAQYEGKCRFPVALLWPEGWDEQGKSFPALKIAVISLLEEWNRVLHYEEISILCSPMEIRLESPLIQQFFDLGNRLLGGVEAWKEGNCLYGGEEMPSWLTCEGTDSLLCIEKLTISRLSMQLSLLFAPDNTVPDTLSPYMKARGLLSLGISKVPIDLSSVETEDLCGFWRRTVNLLVSSYVDDLKSSVIHLLSHVVAGLVTRPVSGVLDLIKHTVTGTVAHFEDLRTRLPRPISTQKGLIRPYNFQLARELYDWVGYREGRFVRFHYLIHWLGPKSLFLYSECLFVFDGSEICLQIEPQRAIFDGSIQGCIAFRDDSEWITVFITISETKSRILRKLTKVSKAFSIE